MQIAKGHIFCCFGSVSNRPSLQSKALKCSLERFGGVEPHRTPVEHPHQVFACPLEKVRRCRTSGCSTDVRCGSNPPNLFELHLSASKHLVRVFHRCSVWFDPSEPLRTTLMDKQTLGKGVRCGSNPPNLHLSACNG